MQFLGQVDRCDADYIEGWITFADHPETKLRLDVILGDQVIAHCTADLFRQDLKDAGIAGGHCAFSIQTPAFVPQSELRGILVRLENSSVFLRMPQQQEQGAGLAPASETVSRFGGLWIDRHDFIDRLALKHRAGEISDELSLQIFRFVRDGYVILKQAVSPNLIAKVNQEVEKAWKAPPPGLLIETFEPEGKMRTIPPDVAFRNGATKLLDLFAFSSVVREAIASPKAVEFLSAIFEDKPKAFQSLNFWNGSEQDIHKDTAYVKIDSNPMHLAATWLALEDVKVGTGELEYYIGSHRAPDFLFGGVSKWMESYTTDHPRFLQSLHEDGENYSHRKGSFLGKAGDVLVWHADLAHGGSRIAPPIKSRRSFVTHYTAARDEPFYRRKSNNHEAEERGCVFVSQYTDI